MFHISGAKFEQTCEKNLYAPSVEVFRTRLGGALSNLV